MPYWVEILTTDPKSFDARPRRVSIPQPGLHAINFMRHTLDSWSFIARE
jgi:hypothetical protein